MNNTTETTLTEQVAEEHGLEADAFTAYCANLHITTRDDMEDNVSAFEDAYIGYMSVRDYAEELISDLYHGADETLITYFDYDSFARDLQLGGDVWEYDGYLFRGY